MGEDILSRETILDIQGIKIIKNIHVNECITYVGINLNDDAVNKYIQSPSLEDVKSYILSSDIKLYINRR